MRRNRDVTWIVCRSIVAQFAEDVVAFDDAGYDGRNCSLMGTENGVPYSWSVVGSMLFAITVYTTVGPCRVSLSHGRRRSTGPRS